MSEKGTTWRKQETSRVYDLTEREQIILGLKKPKPLEDLIHIIIPVHHTSRSVIWESRFVTLAALKGYAKQYPNLEIVRERW